MNLIGIFYATGSVYLVVGPLCLAAGKSGVSLTVGTMTNRYGVGVGWANWAVGFHAGKMS